ncbi:hypothetical protein Drorol1_Dr00006088 [Drosera rotundifolia]
MLGRGKRKGKKTRPGTPVVEKIVNDILPIVDSEGSFKRGKYLVYTGGGDRCKSMKHYLTPKYGVYRFSVDDDVGSEIIPSAVKEYNVQAYLFNDYWEDIGTIKSFFDAKLAQREEPPKFEFYDPKEPFFTSARFLTPTKVDKCRV